MTLQTISATEVYEMLKRGESPTIIDVRTPLEFSEVHAESAINVPLNKLDVRSIAAGRNNGSPIFVICKAGQRAARACDAFIAAGIENVINVEGGTDAWVRAGLPVVRSEKKIISLERQVRIAAGFIVLIGAVLAATVHPYFVALSAFVGAGLVFAGITNCCGMGLLLAKAPWNQACAGSSCCERK